MARKRRVFVPGLSVHVIHRSHNGITIFHDDAERELFLHYVRTAAAASGVDMHGFVVMSTHWHGLVTPATASALPAAMKMIGEQYVRYFNRKYSRFGTLWTGRYRWLPIRDEAYWLTCLRYIEQNPVRAKMVSTPEAYPWSSYRANALGLDASWLVSHPVYQSLGRTNVDRQAAYRTVCAVMLTDGELAIQRYPEPRETPTNAIELAVAV
jgi:REP-associated tyrosine transposase